jgi:hypothetical protein
MSHQQTRTSSEAGVQSLQRQNTSGHGAVPALALLFWHAKTRRAFNQPVCAYDILAGAASFESRRG